MNHLTSSLILAAISFGMAFSFYAMMLFEVNGDIPQMSFGVMAATIFLFSTFARQLGKIVNE